MATPPGSANERRRSIAGQVAEISLYVEFSERPSGRERLEDDDEEEEDEKVLTRRYQRVPASLKVEAQALAFLDREGRERLQEDVTKGVRRILGRDFDVDPLIIRKGSIEILVIITTISAVLGNYNEFMDRLFKAAEHTRRLVRDILAVGRGYSRNAQYSVLSNVTLGPALESLSEEPAVQAQSQSTGVVSSLLPSQSTSGNGDNSTRIFLWAILAYSMLITVALLISLVVLIQSR